MGQDLRSALVFESTWQQRSLLADVLRGEGFSLISRAATLHDAMTQTEAIAFEVAFVEVSLRAEAGFEFIRSIRFDRCGERRRLPIMVVSADAHRSLIARVRDAGANGFIVKPFSRASLSQQLQRMAQPRAWIESASYAGPDRRRGKDPRYAGPQRRGIEDTLYVA